MYIQKTYLMKVNIGNIKTEEIDKHIKEIISKFKKNDNDEILIIPVRE
jgi:hypothetical protein